MNATETYNYPAFSFALEEPEVACWLQAGPRRSEFAPDFRLDDLDGNPVQLSALRGTPVVLEFGSYSCPIFSDRVPEMERLAREHTDAEFLVVAVREAHPGEITGPHTSLTQKRQAARCLALAEGICRRVLVDDLEGTVHRAYGGAWNPVYVIAAEGRVAFRRAWNHPDEVAQALEALATGGSLPASDSVAMAQLPSRGPMGVRLLERGGRQALLDFYSGAPPPVRRMLQESASEAVRATVQQEDEKGDERRRNG